MDEKLLLLINHEWTSPALDRFMATMSSFAAWLPLLITAGLFVAWRGTFRARAFIVVVVAAVGLSDGIVAHTLKPIVNRPRPHQALNDVRVVDLARTTPQFLGIAKPAAVKLSQISLDEVQGRSFPSGHTMNMTSAAVVAVAFFGWRVWWAFLVALTVGYSRVYVGAHWPGDVFVSIFLALGVMFFYLAAVECAWRTWGVKFFPRIAALHPKLIAR